MSFIQPIRKFALFDLRDLGATFASNPMPCSFQDNIGIQLKWIGTPTGTFGVQVSNDYYPGDSFSSSNAGTWTDQPFGVFSGGSFTIGLTIDTGGAANNAAISLSGVPFAYYRIVFTYASGSGLGTCTVLNKGV